MSANEPETTEDAKWSETPALMLKKVAADSARLLEQKRPAILQFFKYNHLPQHLQDVSAPYSEQAFRLVTTLHGGPMNSRNPNELFGAPTSKKKAPPPNRRARRAAASRARKAKKTTTKKAPAR